MRTRTLWSIVPMAAVFAVLATPARDDGQVKFIDSATVKAAFAKGMPLVEVTDYKIHASRREGPGKAEIHTRDTDILYVLTGEATIVTGGTAVDAVSTAPEELRGSGITGGETRRLVPGDVMVIPNGTPHWFKEATAPFLYYVVKVRQAARSGRDG